MSRVINNLWLCSWEEAKSLVPNLKDPLVFNCTKDLPFITENTIRVPIHDNPDETTYLNKNIFKICRKIYEYISSGLPVVVHCLAGRSRSCSVVACYLIIYGEIPNPIDYIRKIRPGSLMIDNFKETIERVERNVN